jgi:hypothetical protein
MNVSLASLNSLFGYDTGSGASLLQTLYGSAGKTANTSGQAPSAALAAAEKYRARDVKTTAAQPEVRRAVDAFKSGVAAAKTVDQLLRNPAVMKVLLTANGLADQIPYAALTRKALTSKLNDPHSLANTLTDTRWKTVAKTYDFATKGLSIIQDPKVIGTIADGYAELTWRHSLDAQTPGLSNALTFRAQASTVTSALQILGDSVLRDVVTTALKLPKEIAFQSLEAQQKAISMRLDVSKLKDPKFVEGFVQRYLLAAADAAANTPAGTSLTALAVQSQGFVV